MGNINVIYEIEELNDTGEILTVQAVISSIKSDDKNVELNTIYNLEDVQKILKNIKVKIEKEELEVNEIISDDNKSNITTEETTKEEE